MRTISVFRKDLIILAKDRGTYISLFVLPLMFSVVLTLALGGVFGGGSSKTPVTIPIAASTADARAVAKTVSDLPGVIWTHRSAEDARAQVDAGKSIGAVIVSSDGMAVTFYEDPAQATTARLFAGQLKAALAADALASQNTALTKAATGSSDPAVRSAAGAAATADRVEVTTTTASVKGAKAVQPTASEQYIPGFTVAFLFFIATTIAQYMFMERERGTLRRLMTSPVSRTSILVGKLLPNVLIGFGQVAVIFAVGRFLFGMHLGNLPALFLVTCAAVAAANGFGLMITALSKTQAQATGLATLLVFTLATLAGCYVPLSFMPGFMQTLAMAIPQGWAMSAYQSIVIKGAGVADVLPSIGALCAFAIAFFLVALSRFRFRD